MSTRGAYGIRKNETDKIMYNHYDSYPTALGEDILKFIKEHKRKDFDDVFDFLIPIDPKTKPTPEQIKRCQSTTNLSVSKGSTEDWYCLLRETQGNIESRMPPNGVPYFEDYGRFLSDSIFCEWAYIINLDKNVLEIYQGFNRTKSDKGRYASLFREKNVTSSEDKYYGVELLTEIPLEYVPFFNEEERSELCVLMENVSNSRGGNK